MIENPRFTKEPSQMLTPQGMRQRFLLGGHNVMNYGKRLGPLDASNFKIQSTDVYRTI